MINLKLVVIILKGIYNMAYDCGFTAAALPSICSHIDSTNKTHRSYYTDKQLNAFLLSTMNKFLSSIGVAFHNPETKMGEKVINRYVKKLTKLRGREYLQGCSVVVDSAGYQIQNGYLDKPQIEKFNDLYYNYFLQNNSNLFEKAFVLDIIPGYTFCPYDSWSELERFNVTSCESAINLPKPVLDKMTYIHHFRTPKTYELYKRLFFDMDYAGKFNNFAVGGLVNFHAKSTPPCVMYVVPLVDIISKAIETKKKDISFHVLGETEWKSVLAHCFIERHIKEVHDININITFDSSTIFKVLAMGRYTFVLDDDSIFKLPIKSDNMYNTWRSYGTAEDAMYRVVNEAIDGFGIRQLNKIDDPIYPGTTVMNNIFYTYGILQIFKLFNEFQVLCNSIVDELYPIYKSGNDLYFVEKVNEWMSRFNDGRDTRATRDRVANLLSSFDILTNLDRDYTGYLVDRYADGQEYESL